MKATNLLIENLEKSGELNNQLNKEMGLIKVWDALNDAALSEKDGDYSGARSFSEAAENFYTLCNNLRRSDTWGGPLERLGFDRALLSKDEHALREVGNTYEKSKQQHSITVSFAEGVASGEGVKLGGPGVAGITQKNATSYFLNRRAFSNSKTMSGTFKDIIFPDGVKAEDVEVAEAKAAGFAKGADMGLFAQALSLNAIFWWPCCQRITKNRSEKGSALYAFVNYLWLDIISPPNTVLAVLESPNKDNATSWGNLLGLTVVRAISTPFRIAAGVTTLAAVTAIGLPAILISRAIMKDSIINRNRIANMRKLALGLAIKSLYDLNPYYIVQPTLLMTAKLISPATSMSTAYILRPGLSIAAKLFSPITTPAVSFLQRRAPSLLSMVDNNLQSIGYSNMLKSDKPGVASRLADSLQHSQSSPLRGVGSLLGGIVKFVYPSTRKADLQTNATEAPESEQSPKPKLARQSSSNVSDYLRPQASDSNGSNSSFTPLRGLKTSHAGPLTVNPSGSQQLNVIKEGKEEGKEEGNEEGNEPDGKHKNNNHGHV